MVTTTNTTIIILTLINIFHTNRPFPSSKKFHFQNEAKCETFVVEMSFNYDANKTHFHNKGFALSLALKARLFGTRKWPIGIYKVKVNKRKEIKLLKPISTVFT